MVERFAGKILLKTRRLNKLFFPILVILTAICFVQSSVSKNLIIS